ncbi:MAG TPA: hypothetical protein VIH30_00745 [Aquirhabdus sp.]
MKAIFSSTALILGLMTSAGVYAAAPAGATGLCKDGTYHTGANKKGACRGHKGIQEWYAATDATAAVTTTSAPEAAPIKATKVTKTTKTTADVTSSTTSTGATGLCKDGTYYTGANKKGACRGHKGIQTWYATAGTTADVTTAAPTMAPAKVTKTTTTTTSVSPSGAAPAGSTGLCKDGSYYTGANKQGACRGHKGLQEWYGSTAAATVGATAAVNAPAAAPATAPAPEKKGMFSFLNKKPAPTTAAPATTTTTTNTANTTHAAPVAVAAGGGAGKVWVNTESNIYHCEGTHWYGTTKAGSYMTEAAAQAAGARPTRGKACQ